LPRLGEHLDDRALADAGTADAYAQSAAFTELMHPLNLSLPVACAINVGMALQIRSRGAVDSRR
jgi:hypothetical protein